MKSSIEKVLNPLGAYFLASNQRITVEANYLLIFLETKSSYKLVWKFLKINEQANWFSPLFNHYRTTTTTEETLLVEFWTIESIKHQTVRRDNKI